MRFLAPLVLLFASCVAPAPTPESTIPPLVTAALEGTWRVKCPDIGWGSGFVVYCQPYGKVWLIVMITAGHVIDGEDPKGDWTANRDQDDILLMRGKMLYRSTVDDYGLILFRSAKPVRALEISRRPLHFGERLWCAGYTEARHLMVSQGISVDKTATSLSVWWGNSGGPVVDSEGRVVGVISKLMRAQDGHVVPNVAYIAPTFAWVDLMSWIRREPAHEDHPFEWPAP